MSRLRIPPSLLSDEVGHSNHVRYRGYVPVHIRSGLPSPCLRFARTVAGHHARLGIPLLARLYGGCHLRQLCSMRLQGATLIEPDRQVSRIRLSDKTSRLRPRHAAAKPGQTDEPEVLVKVRVRICPALASSGLVLGPQPPAQPHCGVAVECPVRLAGGPYREVVRPAAQRPVQPLHQICGFLPCV